MLGKTVHVVYGCKNIVNSDVVGNKLARSSLDLRLELFLRGARVEDLAQNVKGNTFLDA